MKIETDQRVIETFVRKVTGLEMSSKNLSLKGEVLYFCGTPIARHHNGYVLLQAWDDHEGLVKSHKEISKYLGLSEEKVLELRKEVIKNLASGGIFWWMLPPNYFQLSSHLKQKGYEYFIVPNCMSDVSQDTIDRMADQVELRLNNSMKRRGRWQIASEVGIDHRNHIIGNSSYHSLVADELSRKTIILAKIEGLDHSKADALEPLFNQCLERYMLYHHGGPRVINEFIKVHQLSKHTPVSVVVELMKQPVFRKQQYSDLYEQDLMVRQMAASEVRAKYGAKGDRKKK